MQSYNTVRACLLALCWILLSVTHAAAQPIVEGARLPEALRARGFAPPDGFKALVVRIDRSGDQFRYAWFDWEGTSLDRDNWWPASSVKLFVAVAALERAHELGFSARARLTFDYDDGPVTARLRDVVRQAIQQSNNQAFNRLIEIVGFDDLNARFFVAEHGLASTVFLRSYSGRNPDPLTGVSSARHSPPITIVERNRQRRLPERRGQGDYACPDEGNCTTLRDLAEAMRRVMMHEHLPAGVRYDLDALDLRILRSAMDVARNYRLAEIFEETFGAVEVHVWHKPGYARRWMSDVLFVHRPDTDQRWIVAMAARPGRHALDEAAVHVARVLLTDRLGAAP